MRFTDEMERLIYSVGEIWSFHKSDWIAPETFAALRNEPSGVVFYVAFGEYQRERTSRRVEDERGEREGRGADELQGELKPREREHEASEEQERDGVDDDGGDEGSDSNEVEIASTGRSVATSGHAKVTESSEGEVEAAVGTRRTTKRRVETVTQTKSRPVVGTVEQGPGALPVRKTRRVTRKGEEGQPKRTKEQLSTPVSVANQRG